MIHCAEIVGWAYEGAAYCGDCKPQGKCVDLSPIFADDEGVYTCDKCGYVIDGGGI